MNEYSSASVSELRRMLIESGKYTEETANNIKGKSNLVAAILELKGEGENEVGEEPDFTSLISQMTPVEVTPPKQAINISDILTTPESNSTEWHDYVMQHFASNELEDKDYPNIHGLRRVAELLIGPIVQSGPVNLYPPAPNDTGTGRASCVYAVVFQTDNGQTEFRAAAGASPLNMDSRFGIFPEAIAEVRAEARALRKALKLRCVSSEELFKASPQEIIKPEQSSTGEWSEKDPIGTHQVMFIKQLVKGCNIDLSAFLKHNGYNYNSLEEVTKGKAVEMIALLNEYESRTKSSRDIPTEILAK